MQREHPVIGVEARVSARAGVLLAGLIRFPSIAIASSASTDCFGRGRQRGGRICRRVAISIVRRFGKAIPGCHRAADTPRDA